MGKNLPPPAPRRPVVVPVADPVAAEAFVTGATSAPSALKPPDTLSASEPLSASVSRRKLVSRSDGRQVRRLVAYFDPTLAKSLERWCVDHETDVSAGIVEAVRRMLVDG